MMARVMVVMVKLQGVMLMVMVVAMMMMVMSRYGSVSVVMAGPKGRLATATYQLLSRPSSYDPSPLFTYYHTKVLPTTLPDLSFVLLPPFRVEFSM